MASESERYLGNLLGQADAYLNSVDWYKRTNPLSGKIEKRFVNKGKKPRGKGWERCKP